ncbi:MAG: hypothetical protein EP329_26010 [Deltaproteobacteria bacterium]|nr:MAG: hypothetical protein EP329_26010 [Deltaproteobacteria bacterium]
MIAVRTRELALVVGIGAASLVAACGGSDNGGAKSCSGDTACEFGLICGDDSTCVELPCTSSGDCLNGDQACVTVAQAQVCAAVECGCASCDACPIGETCNNGVCGVATTVGCSGPQDCAANEVCDNETCRACVGAECPTTDCTTDGCDSGYHCDETSKLCVADSTGGVACDTCASADDCGTGWKCAPLISGNACLPPCTSNDECATGWLCQAGNCTPSNFNCDTCMGSGCEAGNACNPNSGACVAATAQCESCGNDWECGAGSACYQGTCVPRCDDGVCASGGSCVANQNQIQVCESACSNTCSPACSGATPHCVDGGCVQCRDENDCSPDQTCNAGTCSGGSSNCVAPTPYVLGDSCVECVSNDHCNGLFCNSQTHKCESDVCASCVDPYPACTQIGTDFYCVQCDSDDDCGLGGTCNQSTFACEGGTVTNTDPCENDADCDDGGVSGYQLACDTSTGYCYDLGGSCDGVTAYCPGTLPSTGAPPNCISILDAFGGGGAGGLPGGGATIPGFCGCEPLDPLGLTSTCQSGFCLDLAAILALLGGGGTPSSSGAFCFSLN